MQSPELALELRAARPLASAELQERVRKLAAHEEAARQRRRFALPPLRVVALAGAAVLAIGVGGAFVHGLAHSGGGSPRASGSAQSAPRTTLPQTPPNLGAAPVQDRALEPLVPRATGRLRQYGASLRVQVKNREDLSDATKHAMLVARLLGGYVASAQYSAPGHGRGAAWIVVRIPIDRVQDAVDEYAALGTLLAQKVAITDVTKAVQEEAKEIARLRADIARLERDGVTPDERARYDADKARLAYLTKRKVATVRRAQFARIALELTTKPKEAAAPASRFHRTMSDAGDVLLRESEILLYALIVAGPLLLIGALAIGAARLTQRRRDAQLLERS